MKIINHIIFTDIGGSNKLMINSLNGLMDKVDNNTFETIARWKKCDEIVPAGDKETALYDSLCSRGYLVNSREEEVVIKNKILDQLRQKHAKAKSNNRNITFIMTYDCNFRCPYCFEGVAGRCEENNALASHSKTAVLTPDMIDAALNMAGEELQYITLFGGEPLLPKTRSAIEYIVAKAPNMTYQIITNGYYLEEFFDLLSQITIASVMVTLDGEEETHNKRRYLPNGKPTYKKIIAGIEKYLDNGIPICIRMNLDNSNFDECNRLKLKLLEQFSHHGELLSFEISPMLEATTDERNKALSELYNTDINYSYDERKQRNRFLGRFSPLINNITSGTKVKPVYSFCYAHDNGYMVDPYGYIFPCLLAVGVNELAIGKYYPAVEFKENSIRNRNIDTIPKCRECIYSLLCGGGCAISLGNYSDVFKPVCFNILNQIHNMLPMLFNANDENTNKSKTPEPTGVRI